VKQSFAEWHYRVDSYSELFFVASGIGAGVIAAAGFGFVNVLVYQTSARFPVAEITFFRALVGVCITLPIVCGQLRSLLHPQSVSIWVRAAAGAGSILCLAWNLAHASMALANVLFSVFLIFLVAAGAIVGEISISGRLLSQLMLILFGIVIYWFAGDKTVGVAVAVIGLAGALCAAVSYTALKEATKIAGPWLINWSLCAAMLLVSGLQADHSWSLPTVVDGILLLSIGIVALCSQYLTIVSFARLPLALASALSPSVIVWSVVVDAMVGGARATLQECAGATVYTMGICLLAASLTVRRDVGHRSQVRVPNR
jgi:drug/metabolite transporter (DMT)-like permease